MFTFVIYLLQLQEKIENKQKHKH